MRMAVRYSGHSQTELAVGTARSEASTVDRSGTDVTERSVTPQWRTIGWTAKA